MLRMRVAGGPCGGAGGGCAGASAQPAGAAQTGAQLTMLRPLYCRVHTFFQVLLPLWRQVEEREGAQQRLAGAAGCQYGRAHAERSADTR
jgi:hypothetical protein